MLQTPSLPFSRRNSTRVSSSESYETESATTTVINNPLTPRHLLKHARTTCRTQLLYITRFITPTPHHSPITIHHPSPLRSAPQHIRDPFAAPVATSQTFPTFS